MVTRRGFVNESLLGVGAGSLRGVTKDVTEAHEEPLQDGSSRWASPRATMAARGFSYWLGVSCEPRETPTGNRRARTGNLQLQANQDATMNRETFAVILIGVFLGVPTFADDEPDTEPDVVPPGAKLETLWNEGGFTEGAAVAPDGVLYFSDFAQPFDARPARIMRFNPRTRETTVHCADSKMANGLMFDRQGRLIACCASPLGGKRALVEVLPNGTLKTIVARYQGKRFNSPNDLVIDRQDRIYFSDPKYVGPEKMELPTMDVYRYDPDGSLHRVTFDISKPNGVMLSPDEKTLYVAETDNGTAQAEIASDVSKGRMTLNAFPVRADGTLGAKRVLVDFAPENGIDGMTVDRLGNLYAAVRSEPRFGIVVFSPEGKERAYIRTPVLPTNCCFGLGDDAKTLYITAGSGFYRIRLAIEGHRR